MKTKNWDNVEIIVEWFLNCKRKHLFAIDDIINHLFKNVSSNEVPSRTYIQNFLKR